MVALQLFLKVQQATFAAGLASCVAVVVESLIEVGFEFVTERFKVTAVILK